MPGCRRRWWRGHGAPAGLASRGPPQNAVKKGGSRNSEILMGTHYPALSYLSEMTDSAHQHLFKPHLLINLDSN